MNFVIEIFDSFEDLKEKIITLEKFILLIDNYYLHYFETDQHFCYHFIVIEQNNETGIHAYNFFI